MNGSGNLQRADLQHGPKRYCHGLDSVAHQVDQHLLNLDAIEAQKRQAARSVQNDTDASSQRVFCKKIAGFHHDFGEIDRGSHVV